MANGAFQDAAMWPVGHEDRWMLRNPPDHRPVTSHDRSQVWKDLPPEQQTTFADILDVINPLQHIPLVNIAYRELTGDELSPPGRILGGLLYGGPLGMAVGAVEAVIEADTGRDFGAHAVAMLSGDDGVREVRPSGVLADASDAGGVAGPAVSLAPAPAGSPAAAPGAPAATVAAAAAAGAPLTIDSRLDAALMALATGSRPAVDGAAPPTPAEPAAFAGWPPVSPGSSPSGPAVASPAAMAAAAAAYQDAQPLAAAVPAAGSILPRALDDETADDRLSPGAIRLPF